ncbi:MAG: MFS transporter [Bacteroidales bacterium]|nr:MFS transporter [Bacteroidales bacterium]
MQSPNNSLPDGLPMPQRLFSVITVSLGVTLAVMDGTIVNVALPSMAQALSITDAQSIWIVNSYQLTIIMLLLAMSAIGEIYSYRRLYVAGLSIFTLASLCCGLSTGFQSLVLGRLLQGVGAAAMMSINMTLLRLSYPKRLLGKGIGWNATIVALASVAGPSLAALILSTAHWRWLFLINIPIGLIGLILGCRNLPKNVVKLSERRFPRVDVVLNALFFGSIILALEGISHGFDLWTIGGLILLALLVGYAYLHRQLHMRYPLLPIDLLRIPLFSLSVVTSIASFTSQMLAMVAVPFFFQQQLGLTGAETGMLFTAWPVVIMFAAPLAGSLIGKVHAGLLGGIGLALLTLGTGSLALLTPDATHLDIIWRLMLCGMGFGLFQSPNNNILMTSAPPARSGSASGMLAMARLTGQTTGATLVALFFGLLGSQAPRAALFTAALVSLLACLLSLSRLKLKSGPKA